MNDNSQFTYGQNEVLSNVQTDISFNQSWYPEGYKIFNCFNEQEILKVRTSISDCINRILISELGIDNELTDLKKYHKYVTNDESHQKIIKKTRKLFSDDFKIPMADLYYKFEQLLGFRLSNINPVNNSKHHIIIRINRPFSNDYNPPHKDIYGGLDEERYIPRYINFWIPSIGVTKNSSLPLVPSSHLISEKKILRTKSAGIIDGKIYHVRSIKSWNGSNNLKRVRIKEGEVLIFSSHLIHGLAINEEADTTRIALEFRLFRH